MKKSEGCQCDGKGWIRMPGTKAIIFCPGCEKPKILRRAIKTGTKIVSTTFGTGEVVEDAKTSEATIKVKFNRTDQNIPLNKTDVSYMYDQD